jgi:DNA-directed RNA polymerase specialized sigma24 family protein
MAIAGRTRPDVTAAARRLASLCARPGVAEAYVRVIMVNLFIDGARGRSRRNRALPLLGGAEVGCDLADQVVPGTPW